MSRALGNLVNAFMIEGWDLTGGNASRNMGCWGHGDALLAP